MKNLNINNTTFFMIGAAKSLGAEHAEDVVQEVWIRLIGMDRKEGGLERIMYLDGELNIAYLYKMVRTEVEEERRRTIMYNNMKDAYICNNEKDPRINDIYEIFKFIDKDDLEFFIEYIEDSESERSMAEKHSITKHAARRIISNVRKKISKYLNQKG